MGRGDLISLERANNIGGVYEDFYRGTVRELSEIENVIEQFNNGSHFTSVFGSIYRSNFVGIKRGIFNLSKGAEPMRIDSLMSRKWRI